MKLVHISDASILLLLDESLNIVETWRVRRNQRLAPCIVRMTGLRSTAHGGPEFRDDHFVTDGLGCFGLLCWIADEHPDLSARAQYNRFERLFSDNPTDAITATMRIYAGCEDQAAGETAFFIADQWTHHPGEMTAIKALGAMR